MYSNNYGNASVIKGIQFSTKYNKYTFNRTIVNFWKAKCKNINAVFNKAGRLNLLDDNLIKKVKNILICITATGGAIKWKQILNIATEVVGANNKNALEEYGRTLHLTDR